MDRPPDLNELTELAELERLVAKLEAGARDDEPDETPLPPPLGYLPAWWGPVIDEKARQALDTDVDLVELALEHGHDDETLVNFASDNLPMHQYLVVEKLGVREWSAVYIAIDMLSGRVVVLKISLRETDREGRHVVRVQHRNVVTLLGMLVHEGYPTFVLEWCSQNTLGDYAIRAKDWHPVLARVIEGGEGLAFCHERGLVHGDVKPTNFLVGEDIGKLADLGIARTPTTEGPVWGTVFYMPPERLKGVWSFAGDVFAFGLVVEQVLRPFGTVADEFAALVDRATAEDPSARPSMDEVLAELRAIAAALDGDRRQLEQLREREAIERERAELASSRIALDTQRAELASSRIELDTQRAQFVASQTKLRARMWLGGVVASVMLVVASIGVGMAMSEREADPVGDTLEKASKAAEHGEAVKAVLYLEAAFKLGLTDGDTAALTRVAEAAERLGHEFVAMSELDAAHQSWFVATECYVELGDVEGQQRVLGFGRALIH